VESTPAPRPPKTSAGGGGIEGGDETTTQAPRPTSLGGLGGAGQTAAQQTRTSSALANGFVVPAGGVLAGLVGVLAYL
jgi:hypothetical protein